MEKKLKLPQRTLRTGIPLFFLCFLLSAWPGGKLSSQILNIPDPITINAESITLADLIIAIQKQTAYTFSYDLKISALVVEHIQWIKTPLRQALAEMASKAHLQYALLDKNIAITVKEKKEEDEKKLPLSATLKGRIVDYETNQPLPGASVGILETGRTVIANDKGYYEFTNLPEGVYTLVISYTGYEKNVLPGIRVTGGHTAGYDVKMAVGKSLDQVIVASGAHRIKTVTHYTEKDLVKEIRNETGVVSGISNEAISRTADRNAAEVMKRISGVTVVDNRFVVVRGMNERYNLTYLNDNIAPSTELYKRAFAYDLLPSSIIDRVLVYKSPRADLNGMFAGAAIKVFTKNAMPVKHFDIGVQLADRPGSTMTNVNSYSGGRLDWLGVDDGTRKLPSWSPGVFQTTKAVGNVSQADMVKGFSPTLTYGQSQSTPDMQAYANYYNNWRISRRVRLYDLTSVTYTKETTNFNQQQQTGNTDAYMVSPATGGDGFGQNNRIGNYQQTTEIGKVNVLENLTLKLGRHNTLQFKNFFVNDGRTFTGINDYRLNTGPQIDTADGLNRYKDIVLSFQQRTLYSGNLGGAHEWGKALPQDLAWNLGYTYDMQNVPDQRISHFQTSNTDPNAAYEPGGLIYTAVGTNTSDNDEGFYGMISRIFIKNEEEVYNYSTDYTLHLSRDFQIKTGTFQLYKTRQVGRRTFRVNRGGLGPTEVQDPLGNPDQDGWPVGAGFNNPNILGFRLQDLGKIWNPANFAQDGSGLWIYDITSPVDGYTATEQNNAGYVMGDWKMADEKLTVNTGMRMEYDRQKLAGATEVSVGSPLSLVYADHSKTSMLPSVNLSYRPDSIFVFRAGYGRTVDRPEFRELTPYNDFDYINNEQIIGNPALVSSTIDNYDLRAEFYPRSAAQNEVFNIGVFYKYLQDPIERLRLSQSALTDISSLTKIFFENAQSAKVYGVEAEAKKSLSFFGGRLFRRLSIVINGALIKSVTRQYTQGVQGLLGPIDTGTVIQGRPLQGQAPYVFNGGLFYEHPGLGTKIGLTYNVDGPVIYAKSLGNTNDKLIDSSDQASIRPDLLQLPTKLLDFSVTQRIVKSLQLKFSIQNLLDQPYRIIEDQNYNQKYDPEKPFTNHLGQTYYKGDDMYLKYNPGRYFLLAFTYAF